LKSKGEQAFDGFLESKARLATAAAVRYEPLLGFSLNIVVICHNFSPQVWQLHKKNNNF